MKRFALLLLAVPALAGSLAVIPRLIPAEALGDRFEARMEELLGLEVDRTGATRLSLLPLPSLRMEGLRVLSPQGEVVGRVRTLDARLAIAPLLSGRLEPVALTLEYPGAVFGIDQEGGVLWAGSAPQPLDAILQHNPAFRRVSFHDGRVAISDDRDNSRQTIMGVAGTLELDANGRFAAEGSFLWRGEVVRVAGTIGDIRALNSGQNTALAAGVTSKPLTIRFTGEGHRAGDWILNGKLLLESPAVDWTAAWMLHDAGERWPHGPMKLHAEMERLPSSLALSKLDLALGQTRANGALTLDWNGERPLLQGSLAAEMLDFQPLLRQLDRFSTPSGRSWSRTTFDTSYLLAADADLRISAAKAVIGRAQAEDVALLANLRNGRLVARVEDARLFDGSLAFDVQVDVKDSGLQARSTFSARAIDLGALSSALNNVPHLRGQADVHFTLSGSGGSPYALARGLNGQIRSDARDGRFQGINLAQQLRRLERTPLAVNTPGSGYTSFSSFTGVVDIENGQGRLSTFRMEGPDVALSLGGSVDTGDRMVSLTGTASRREGAADEAFALPFAVEGSWTSPAFRPDAQTLLRRSGAAASLFPPQTAPVTTGAAPGMAEPAAAPPPR